MLPTPATTATGKIEQFRPKMGLFVGVRRYPPPQKEHPSRLAGQNYIRPIKVSQRDRLPRVSLSPTPSSHQSPTHPTHPIPACVTDPRLSGGTIHPERGGSIRRPSYAQRKNQHHQLDFPCTSGAVSPAGTTCCKKESCPCA